MICPANHDYLDACCRLVVAYDSEDYRCLVVDQATGRLVDALPPLVSLNQGEAGSRERT